MKMEWIWNILFLFLYFNILFLHKERKNQITLDMFRPKASSDE